MRPSLAEISSRLGGAKRHAHARILPAHRSYTINMTIEEQLARLTGIVESLATTVVAHDNQIEGLITVAEQHSKQIEQQSKQIAALERQWQAYINTLPRQ